MEAVTQAVAGVVLPGIVEGCRRSYWRQARYLPVVLVVWWWVWRRGPCPPSLVTDVEVAIGDSNDF